MLSMWRRINDGVLNSRHNVFHRYQHSSPPIPCISVDIEEITLKAGNFKKFGVFAKMLRSALNKESESLYIDLLTYSDLESLKAKKLGTASNSNTSVSTLHSSSTQLKRYVILTYTGEYDRVHYPLPLNFEETPNVEALRRTIRRLRNQLDSKHKEESSRSIIDAAIEP